MSIVASLNISQLQAVQYQGRYLLIIAGPGTGKTHTLTYRIAEYVRYLSSGQKILAITFTNKAAQEMRVRLMPRIIDLDEKVLIGTFHQFCLFLLKKYILETSLPKDFQIVSQEQIKKIAQELWPDLKTKDLKDKLEGISRWKAMSFGQKKPRDVVLYDKHLRQYGFLDFDDLLCEAGALLKGNFRILKEIQKSFPHVFVDEYQDINCCQHDLLKLLVGPENFLTAIGDPNQAIYGFRGADVKFFESFQDDFQGAQEVFLSDNYRSSKDLLSASSQVITKSQTVSVAPLVARIYLEGKLIVRENMTEKAEAEYVVHEIEKLVGGISMFSQDSGRVETDNIDNKCFGDIAVFCRMKAQMSTLANAFERSGIPYETPKIQEQEFLENPDIIRMNELYEKSERVQLMTLHAAKGLEFSVVFIVGCEEGLLPLNREELITDIEEERRLFYVGMTRAKEKLYLTYAKRRFLFGKKYHNETSRFIADIHEELKQYEKDLFKPKKIKQEAQGDLFSV
ncbi:MAG TPA: ATP-dependent helicase [Candidatus Omnitrophota bacterium]|nr:ATP-dependent helicase [Candidatus Omnitrophota bacterium]